MDPAELRKDLESLLDIIGMLSSSEVLSEEDLQNVDAVCSDIREKLQAAPVESVQHFPRGHWVFGVQRTQFSTFSIEAANESRAFHAAAAYLHDNIEALRFTWDRNDPLTLSVLTLKRDPGVPHAND